MNPLDVLLKEVEAERKAASRRAESKRVVKTRQEAHATIIGSKFPATGVVAKAIKTLWVQYECRCCYKTRSERIFDGFKIVYELPNGYQTEKFLSSLEFRTMKNRPQVVPHVKVYNVEYCPNCLKESA